MTGCLKDITEMLCEAEGPTNISLLWTGFLLLFVFLQETKKISILAKDPKFARKRHHLERGSS